MNKANQKENAYSIDWTSSIFFAHQMIMGSSMPFVKNTWLKAQKIIQFLCVIVLFCYRKHEVC